MSTTVSPCPNRSTWDATVRVTGGHPQQLWGVGEAQITAEGPALQVDRVMVHDAEERTVGYAQLLLRAEAEQVVAGTVQCHVRRPEDLPELAGALAAWARDRRSAVRLRVETDAPEAPRVAEALTAAGFTRPDTGPSARPRRLEVLVGGSERELSARLSAKSLERCRSALRTPGVRVREVAPHEQDLVDVGLRTRLIGTLLEDLGENSLLLVATESSDGGPDSALGYLWFVHARGLAMIYRLGFTGRARELGVDGALLLTGLVELQKRGVQRLDGGDPGQPDVPPLVRELAEPERPVLGVWEKALERRDAAGPLPEDAGAAAGERTGTPAAAEPGVAQPVLAPSHPPEPEETDTEPAEGGEEATVRRGLARVRDLTRRVVGEGLSALRDAAGR